MVSKTGKFSTIQLKKKQLKHLLEDSCSFVDITNEKQVMTQTICAWGFVIVRIFYFMKIILKLFASWPLNKCIEQRIVRLFFFDSFVFLVNFTEHFFIVQTSVSLVNTIDIMPRKTTEKIPQYHERKDCNHIGISLFSFQTWQIVRRFHNRSSGVKFTL